MCCAVNTFWSWFEVLFRIACVFKVDLNSGLAFFLFIWLWCHGHVRYFSDTSVWPFFILWKLHLWDGWSRQQLPLKFHLYYKWLRAVIAFSFRIAIFSKFTQYVTVKATDLVGFLTFYQYLHGNRSLETVLSSVSAISGEFLYLRNVLSALHSYILTASSAPKELGFWFCYECPKYHINTFPPTELSIIYV